MRRRQFIASVGGALAWPLKAKANRPDKPRRVGILALFPASDPRVVVQFEMFRQRLRELGWLEHLNIAFEIKYPEDSVDKFAKPAAELVASSDIIVTSGTPPVQALQRLTRNTPIVAASIGDPVGAGLVASLARPGGNVTGFSLQATELATKRLEVIRDAIPGLTRLALLWNPENPSLALQFEETEEAANKLGLELLSLRVITLTDIRSAIAAASQAQAHAICATSDGVQTANRALIAKLAIDHMLPLMGEFKTVAEAGALLSYGPAVDDLWRRAAEYADRILRGENPAELPIQRPTKFELVINLKTARAIGLIVPPMLLARADVVIE